MRFEIFSLFLFCAGCLGPKITDCVLDPENSKSYCVSSDEKKEPYEMLIKDMKGYGCLSPADWSILLKWIEDHRK